MSEGLSEELTDAVYRAALDHDAWRDVMRLIGQRFPSNAQAFYFLHLEPRQLRPVYFEGVESRWLRSFDALYFAADNPWMRVSKFLHRPGVIRTTERLEQFLHEPGVLQRSSYFNEWMRPQRFQHNLGNTLLSEDGIVANITLFRPPDMPTFGEPEVRAFESLSGHLTRALQMAARLSWPGQGVTQTALDALPHAVALVDSRRQVRYANPVMESLLRREHGLAVRANTLQATHVGAQAQLDARLDAALAIDRERRSDGAPLVLPCRAQGHLHVRTIPIARGAGALPLRPLVLLLATECAGTRAMTPPESRARYGFTAAEARLARLVAEGRGLRQAASLLGVTYGTARACLKVVFHKAGVHTQAQLVAQMLADAAVPPPDGAAAAHPSAVKTPSDGDRQRRAAPG